MFHNGSRGRDRSGAETVSAVEYDRIGLGYADRRRPDPLIATAIDAALGDACCVLNVGAGTGSYESPGRQVLAVEPSAVMVAQRPANAAPAVRGVAAALSFADDCFDAATAFLTVHHWADHRAGLAELVRVARERLILLTFDVPVLADFWLLRDYLPELLGPHQSFPKITELCEWLPGADVIPVPIGRACTDGFPAAFWCRPEAFFDPAVRAAGSAWHGVDPAVLARGLDRLRADLGSGAWEARNTSDAPSYDGGLRLVVAPAR